jgi:hypothetical protein
MSMSPKHTQRQRSKTLYALVTAVVMAAAAAVWHNLPTPNDVYGPFDVHAGIGKQATGRAITATVTGARIAPQVRKLPTRGTLFDALGVWVAVDTVMTATETTEKPYASLVVGPNTYVPTQRLGVGPLGGALAPGIAQHGAWVFDVPPDLVAAGPRDMKLRLWVGDGRLDSRLVISVRLDDPRVHRDHIVELEPLTETGV